jgi:hypothetical protein
MDQYNLPLDPRHIGVSSGVSKMISKPMVHSAQSVHVQNDFWAYNTFGANCAPILCQDWHYLQTNPNELPHDSRHEGVSSGVSKKILEPMIRSAQTVHLSCVEINTITKLTEMSFHLTDVN